MGKPKSSAASWAQVGGRAAGSALRAGGGPDGAGATSLAYAAAERWRASDGSGASMQETQALPVLESKQGER